MLGPMCRPAVGEGATGGTAGGAAGRFAGIGLDGGVLGVQLSALAVAARTTRRRIGYSLLLVRPKMATTSVSSLVTLSSFHPRLSMSFRQVMSFSHSGAVVRKTRRSATFSQWGG